MENSSFDEVDVPQEKITNYLLSVDHPEGGSKARFFLSRGFTSAQWRDFAEALRRQAIDGEISNVVVGQFGDKLVVGAAICCPDRSSPTIRTVWFAASEGSNPRLVTAHPLK